MSGYFPAPTRRCPPRPTVSNPDGGQTQREICGGARVFWLTQRTSGMILRLAHMDDLHGFLQPQSHSRLVVISNRVPAEGSAPGGLAVAMTDALSERECLWLGWDGDAHAKTSGEVRLRTDDKTTFALVSVAQDEFAKYYEGYANGTLWPALHYRLDLSVFDREEFEAYKRVNRLFAEKVAERLQPDDIVWVHDYHLITAISELRELGVSNPVGFFSHIPFPSPEIFDAIPGCRQLADGLLSADLVGFQAKQDRDNFERYVATRLGGYWLSDGRISARGKIVKPAAFPIGIDAGTCREMAETSFYTPRISRLRDQLGARPLIIGVDRLDYSKGLIERVDAFDHFLAGRQQHGDLPTLLQIAPVSRGTVSAYVQLREQLEQRIGRINGKHAELDWTPIQFLTTPVPRNEVAGLLKLARVGLITPLRDGMNLVAKEYVAAQDPSDPGVLVLSQFAGAAEQLKEALVVNPHDARQQAKAIRAALSMPIDERRERHRALLSTLETYDSSWWCSEFLGTLSAVQQSSAGLADAIGAHFGYLGSAPRDPVVRRRSS